jgi:hypothetical protein
MPMVLRRFLVIAVLLFLTTVTGADDRSRSGAVTRESVVESMNKRRGQLELLLAETKKKLDDHKMGRALLEGEERERLEKRVDLVQRKIEKYTDVNDEEIERTIRREQLRLERGAKRRRRIIDEL